MTDRTIPTLFAAALLAASATQAHPKLLQSTLAVGPGNPDEATIAFRRSLVPEAAAAVVILAVVARLGLLDPAGTA